MALATKLQLKPKQRIRLVNVPAGFDIDVETAKAGEAEAVLVFARNRRELAQYQETAIDHARKDHLAWIAYPKAGQLGTDLNRDVLWKLLEGKACGPSVRSLWMILGAHSVSVLPETINSVQ